MKDFLKHIFATFIGILIFAVVASFIAVIGFVGTAASLGSSSAVSLKDGSVLVLKLDGGVMPDRNSSASLLNMIPGNSGGQSGLTETISAIQKAKENDKVKGIYIEAGDMTFYPSQMQELRKALADFKSSGKWIVAYGEVYQLGNYYIASVADKVYMNPQGMVEWDGLGGKIPMMKDYYAKFGIKFMAFKCGKYKSAVEPYTEDKLSEPARVQEERSLQLRWASICSDVSQSRGISVDSLNSYADNMLLLEDPQTLVKKKMVDGLLYYDQMKAEIKKRLGLDKDDDIPQVTVADMETVDNKDEGDKVAVYYASGDIYDVAPPNSSIQGTECIVGPEMVEDLQKLADDDDVKAVVLRINSPGGSAYASEQIWHAVEMLKAKKPVVVSMSGAAASGGYYISSGASYIFADPMTITGSIGIFGLLPDGSSLLKDKLGIKYESFKTNRNSLFFSSSSLLMGLVNVLNEPLTAEQQAKFQASINRGYRNFKSRVAQGRHMTMAQVEDRAQGHVFLGVDAFKLKLVDDLGGLDAAVTKAAQLAKLEKYHTVDYPEQKSILEQFLGNDSESTGTYLDDHLRMILGDFYEPVMATRNLGYMNCRQMRLPYNVANY